MWPEWVRAASGQCKGEPDNNYLILSVITDSCELRLKAHWSFTRSAACSFLFYCGKSEASNDSHWTFTYQFYCLLSIWMLVVLSLSCLCPLVALCSEISADRKQLFVRRMMTRHRKKEEQQGKISEESCRSVIATSSQLLEAPPLGRKRGNEYWKETCSQDFVTLSSLEALCVPISLLQIVVSFFALS